MMERRMLGRAGYEATILGFGAMEIRGHRIWDRRPVTDAQAARILGAALALLLLGWGWVGNIRVEARCGVPTGMRM